MKQAKKSLEEAIQIQVAGYTPLNYHIKIGINSTFFNESILITLKESALQLPLWLQLALSTQTMEQEWEQHILLAGSYSFIQIPLLYFLSKKEWRQKSRSYCWNCSLLSCKFNWNWNFRMEIFKGKSSLIQLYGIYYV